VNRLFVAALTILTLLALTGLFEDLPEATLAAIVIAAVIELVDYRALIELYRAHTERSDASSGSSRVPTSSPRLRPCSASPYSTRCPACSSASVSRCCC